MTLFLENTEPENLLYEEHPRVLVLVPTGELAVQVEDEIRNFGVTHVACLNGGQKNRFEGAMMGCKSRIVVGTPDRINYFIQNQYLNGQYLKFLGNYFLVVILY